MSKLAYIKINVHMCVAYRLKNYWIVLDVVFTLIMCNNHQTRLLRATFYFKIQPLKCGPYGGFGVFGTKIELFLFVHG